MSSTAQARNPTRKQVLTDMRREEILTAAIKVFGKKGFAATCVGDVADAAKMAKGTVYLYFESKEEIYATAIRLAVERLQALADGADAARRRGCASGWRWRFPCGWSSGTSRSICIGCC